VPGQEALAQGAIEIRILLEPTFRPGLPPQIDHVQCFGSALMDAGLAVLFEQLGQIRVDTAPDDDVTAT
jgi:hypothetical protein